MQSQIVILHNEKSYTQNPIGQEIPISVTSSVYRASELCRAVLGKDITVDYDYNTKTSQVFIPYDDKYTARFDWIVNNIG